MHFTFSKVDLQQVNFVYLFSKVSIDGMLNRVYPIRMTFREEIGQKVKNLRLDARVSQQDLAREIGCSGGLLASIENGRKSLTLEMAFKIEIALGCTGRELSEPIIQAVYASAGGSKVAETSSPKHPPLKPDGAAEDDGRIEKLNDLRDRRERILGEVISVPVKLPRAVYLRLEFE